MQRGVWIEMAEKACCDPVITVSWKHWNRTWVGVEWGKGLRKEGGQTVASR
jgi:hypothetical protein